MSRDPAGYVDGLSLYRAYFADAGNLDPSGLAQHGKRVIRPTEIPPNWGAKQIKDYLDDLIAKKANPKRIKQIEGWLKVVKRGGGMKGGGVRPGPGMGALGPILIILLNPETADAGEMAHDWRDENYDLGGKVQCSCECRVATYTVTIPSWWNVTAPEQKWYPGVAYEWEEMGRMSADACAALAGYISVEVVQEYFGVAVYTVDVMQCRFGGLRYGIPQTFQDKCCEE